MIIIIIVTYYAVQLESLTSYIKLWAMKKQSAQIATLESPARRKMNEREQELKRKEISWTS